MKVPLEMGNRNGLLVPKEYATKQLHVAFATGGHSEEEFWESLLFFKHFDASPQGRHIFNGLTKRHSPFIENNRNECVAEFLKGPCDTLLFIDTDHRFSPQQVYALLDSMDSAHAVVAGLYFNYWENGNIYPVWFERGADGGLQNCTRTQPNTITEIVAAGGGFLAIQRRVLEAMRDAKLDTPDWAWFGRDLVNGVHVDCDMSFCLRAAKLGFKVWGNSHVIVDHKKGRWLGWNDFAKHWSARDEAST